MSLELLPDYSLSKSQCFVALAVLCLLFISASPAYAHKVHIFAYVDGDVIKTESRFNGGRPARNCSVNVQSLSTQDAVITGTSDEQGLFSFPVPSHPSDLDIIISCGDGHRGSWRLEAAEYATAGMEALTHVHEEPAQSARQPQGGGDDMLRRVISEEMEKKLAPLRRDLARLSEKKASLQDILGGIGYFLGLAGLAAYMKYRKKGQ